MKNCLMIIDSVSVWLGYRLFGKDRFRLKSILRSTIRQESNSIVNVTD